MESPVVGLLAFCIAAIIMGGWATLDLKERRKKVSP
jgi:hypothetical protein